MWCVWLGGWVGAYCVYRYLGTWVLTHLPTEYSLTEHLSTPIGIYTLLHSLDCKRKKIRLGYSATRKPSSSGTVTEKVSSDSSLSFQSTYLIMSTLSLQGPPNRDSGFATGSGDPGAMTI